MRPAAPLSSSHCHHGVMRRRHTGCTLQVSPDLRTFTRSSPLRVFFCSSRIAGADNLAFVIFKNLNQKRYPQADSKWRRSGKSQPAADVPSRRAVDGGSTAALAAVLTAVLAGALALALAVACDKSAVNIWLAESACGAGAGCFAVFICSASPRRSRHASLNCLSPGKLGQSLK